MLSSHIRSMGAELQKIAASRLDKEISKGTVQYGDVDKSVPQGRVPKMLEPGFKKHVRGNLRAAAPVSADKLKRRRAINQGAYQARAASTPNVSTEPYPGMVAATAPEGGDISKPQVHSPETSGRLMRTMGKSKNRAMLYAQSTIAGPDTSLGELGNRALLPGARQDPTLNRAVLEHELGEAEEMKGVAAKKRRAGTHASHLGAEPIVRENLITSGDPDAVRDMSRVRQTNPDDALMQRFVRQAGGTPDRPIPLGGKQHKALDQMLARSGPDLTKATRQKSLMQAIQGMDVSHVPDAVKKQVGAEDLQNLFEGLGEGSIGDRLSKAKDLLGRYGRVSKYLKRGV